MLYSSHVGSLFFPYFQSVGSPVCSSSMAGHVSDLSLSGHSHTFTFSSSEVSLSFPSLSFSLSLRFVLNLLGIPLHSGLFSCCLPALFLSSFLLFLLCVLSDAGQQLNSHHQQQPVAEPTHLGVEQPAGVSVAGVHEHGPVRRRVHCQRGGRDAAAQLGW